METSVDKIELFLKAWKHDVWGFVIYRCTYTSDDEFAAFISRLKALTLENLEMYGSDARRIRKQLSWKIAEDQHLLEGASKANVRKRFDEWCRDLVAAAEQPKSTNMVANSQNARYRFCLQVDQASVESLKGSRPPWVNLVLRRWPYGPGADNEEDDGDDDEESLDEVEGSDEEDVGWCRINISSLLPDTFARLCHSNAWYQIYAQPPAIA